MSLDFLDSEFNLKDLRVTEDIHALVVVFEGFHVVLLDFVELIFLRGLRGQM
jgi:hypothetical protein